MKLIDMNLVEFSNAVNSNEPAPGGGSVAAYAANLGAGLACMLAHLTVDKKKFKELDQSVQDEFINAFEQLNKASAKLLKMVDEDTESFNKVMAAFKLAKDSDEEKAIRSQAIQKATLDATIMPLNAAICAYEALALTPKLIEHGNVNAMSDLASGMYLLQAGMNCSILNVKINLGGLKDQEVVNDFTNQINELKVKADKVISDNLKLIEDQL